jgi:hypothetical protein
MPKLAGVAVAVGDAVLLDAVRPRFAPALAVLAHPHAALARSGADGALLPVLSTLVWSAAAWLGLGLLAAVASGLPGSAGRTGALVARLLLPRAARAVLAGSAGLGALLAPVAAGAAPAPHPASAPAATPPAPAWPVPSSASAARTPPAWPVARSGAPSSPAASAPTTSPASAAPTGRASHPGGARRVTVRPGDSLWAITAHRLGPRATPARVAAEWPRWFAANRAVIGDDPDLIRPGQELAPPARPAEEARP